MAVKLEKGSVLSALSLTPLIDVVFLLLIFFLVASRFEEEERSLDLNLPASSEAQALTKPPKQTIINVSKGGDYVVQGQKYSAKELRVVLKTLSDEQPGKAKIMVRADKDTSWQAVFAVFDMCKQANISDYDIATEK